MSNKRKSVALIFIVVGVLLIGLTGCTEDAVNDTPPLTLDEVVGRRLMSTTNDEREAEIYKYVTDRIVVDKTKLIEVTEKDRETITKLFGKVNDLLTGKKNDSLKEEYANYLLMEFAKTPYEWRQSNMDLVGFDPASRLYFVDVTYSTTGENKSVVPDSKIPFGMPEGEELQNKRYTDRVTVMTEKYNGGNRYEAMHKEFEKSWGSVASIMEEQQGSSLLERTQKKGAATGGIGKLTYSGLIKDTTFSEKATMTVRYVLKYRLNLGEETDLQVEALYVKDYMVADLESKIEKATTDVQSVEVLKPFIDQLILSYHKAVEESNDVGLYQLYNDYSTIDKYYAELDKYTYNSIGAYTYKVLNRYGTKVQVQVNRVNQVRARGANMSLPTYDETWIYNLVLGRDDKIRIDSVYPVKVKLIGEPLSVIANVSGISEIIQYSDASFTATNKTKVEELLKRFSKVVTNTDIESQEFLETVDLGVSQTTLNRMVDTITAIRPEKKAMYIVSWDTQTNAYVSVTVREVFETVDGNNDTESVIDLVNRGGEWKVVNYIRKLNIKTGKSSVENDRAFVVDEYTGEEPREEEGSGLPGGSMENQELTEEERKAEEERQKELDSLYKPLKTPEVEKTKKPKPEYDDTGYEVEETEESEEPAEVEVVPEEDFDLEEAVDSNQGVGSDGAQDLSDIEIEVP